MAASSSGSSAAKPIERQDSLERARALVYKPPKSTNLEVSAPSGPAVFDPSFYTHMATYSPTQLGRQTAGNAKSSLGGGTAAVATAAVATIRFVLMEGSITEVQRAFSRHEFSHQISFNKILSHKACAPWGLQPRLWPQTPVF